MPLHRTQEHFARAQWPIKFLALIWTLQLLLTITIVALFADRFVDSLRHHDEKVEAGKTPAVEYAWELTNMSMSLAALLCTFVDVALYCTESLTPRTMVFTHLVKVACALAILGLDIIAYMMLREEMYSLVGIGLDGLLITLTGGMATYAVLAYCRLSAYEDYTHPCNAKGYGFSDYLTTGKTVQLSANHRGSVESGRLSVASLDASLILNCHDSTAYHQQRDTQFEEYMTKRDSFNASRELGRGRPGKRRHSSSPQLPAVTPIGSSTDTITLGDTKALQRGPKRPRISSWASERVLLVAVPEEEGEADDMTDQASYRC